MNCEEVLVVVHFFVGIQIVELKGYVNSYENGTV